MKIRTRIIKTLMKKDMKLMVSNKNSIFMLLMPVLFCVLYTKVLPIGEAAGTVYPLLICQILNMVCIPVSLLSMMVAEEKEKHTLRSLIMSDVSAQEFLCSKMTLLLVAMEVISVVNYLLTGLEMKFFAGYLAISTLSSLGILFLGAAIGIISNDQMSTGTLSSPLMLLMMLPPLFANMNDILEKIAMILPTNTFYQVMSQAYYKNRPFFSGDNAKYYIVSIIWIFIGIIAFNLIYKRRGIDGK